MVSVDDKKDEASEENMFQLPGHCDPQSKQSLGEKFLPQPFGLNTRSDNVIPQMLKEFWRHAL